MKRGESDARAFESKLFALKWMDTKAVYMLSNYLFPYLIDIAKRR